MYVFLKKSRNLITFCWYNPSVCPSGSHLSLKAWLRTPLHKGGVGLVQNYTFLTS